MCLAAYTDYGLRVLIRRAGTPDEELDESFPASDSIAISFEWSGRTARTPPKPHGE